MRPILRYVLLVVLLGFQAVTLVGVLTSNQLRTQAVLREHAQSVMNHLADTASDNTQRFLAPAERAALLSQKMFNEGLLSPNSPAQLEAYFLQQLQTNPELSGIYFGQANGDFFFVRREGSGFLIRRILTAPKRSVLDVLLDQTLNPTRRTLDPANRYDPRSRPWYQAAQKSRSKVWTEPYVFFSSKKPGITAATPVFSKAGTVLGVVGVDIEITGLSMFLENIPISPHGSAFIITRNGQVVAYPKLEQNSPSDSLPQIASVASPSVQGLLAQYPSEQFDLISSRTFKDYLLENQAQYGILSPIKLDGSTWLVGVQAPASDFAGKIGALDSQYLWQIGLIGIATCLLAIPLAFGFTRPMVVLYNQATTDSLTGLPNRAEFLRKAEEALKQATRKGQNAAVVMLDLDGFKEVNDQHGHPIGDEVLTAVAKRISHVVREGDVVGRLGGDEFAFVLVNVQPLEVEFLAERIRTSISDRPIKSRQGLHLIGASAGVVLSQGQELLEQISKADQALLQAKISGKNQTLVMGQ